MKIQEKNYKELMATITTFVFDVDGVLTDGTILVTENGNMLRNMNIKDGYALKTAVESGYRVVIISGGSNEGVKIRLQNLGIADVFLGVSNKITVLNDYCATHKLKKENLLYMGDDLPDYEVMQHVGLATCPQNAVPEIKAVSSYVSHIDGGKGCARDVIEQVLKVQGKWLLSTLAKYD